MKPTLNRTIKKELALLSEQYSGWWVSSYPLTVPGRAAFTRNCVIGEPTFNNNFEVDNNIPQLGQVFMGWGGPTMMRFIAPHSFTSNDHIAGQGGLIDNPNATCPPYNNNCVGDPNQTWAIKQVTEVYLPPGLTMAQWCPEWCSGQSFGPTSAQPSPLCDAVPGPDYHMWQDCSGLTGIPMSMTAQWLPGYDPLGFSPTFDPIIAANNSQLFYDWIDTTIGGISVGDVIKIDVAASTGTVTICLKYEGITQQVQQVAPWAFQLTILSNHPDCKDCLDEPEMPYCCLPGTPCFQITFPTECDWGTTYPDLPTCQANCGDPEERGCLDPSALNYNECCPNTPGCTPVLPDPECCRFEHDPDQKGCLDSTASNYMDCCDLTIPGCTPTIQYDECCKYEGGGEDKGCMDPSATNYNICCNGDPNCTVVGSNQECCKYEEDPDEKGCMDPSAINYMDCCPQSNYPGCVATLPYDCCKYEGGETKHCTCCKKTENGTIAGFSIITAIPVGDSCSQFNNSQPGLYGCVDSTTWSLVKCKTQIGPPNKIKKDLPLSEEIKRIKELL